jgi:hypothetical protein
MAGQAAKLALVALVPFPGIDVGRHENDYTTVGARHKQLAVNEPFTQARLAIWRSTEDRAVPAGSGADSAS